MAEVVWSRNAIERVSAIGEYIATSSERHAELVVERIYAAVEHVGRFPKLGRAVPEFDDEDIREVFYQDYRIVYDVTRGGPRILTVLHGAMDLAAQRTEIRKGRQ